MATKGETGLSGISALGVWCAAPEFDQAARSKGKHYQTELTDRLLCELQLRRAYERTALQACCIDCRSCPRGQEEEEEEEERRGEKKKK